MDAELKAKWVEALRSGKFHQARETLQDETGANCCLGVLARIQGVDLEEWTVGDRETSCLPSNLAAGLDAGDMIRLARMNDGSFDEGEKHSFAEIADYIEKNL